MQALAPVAPRGGELAPGVGQAMEGGKPVSVSQQVAPNNQGVILGGTGWNLNLLSGRVSSQGDPGNPTVSLQLVRGSLLKTKGSGYAPNSRVLVNAQSTPTLLGYITTDAEGNFDGSVTIPAEFTLGGHTLQVNALTKSGAVRSASLGVVVVAPNGKSASAPVFFKRGSSVLGPQSKKTLQTLLGAVPLGAKSSAVAVGVLAGGASKAERELGQARAAAVAAYLAKQGFRGTTTVRTGRFAGSGTWRDARVDTKVSFGA